MQNNCEGQTVSLAIQHVFWEVVLLFFFLLVCEILSPVCPPKKLFKNLHIDIQHFIQQKYHLRGEINILYREVMACWTSLRIRSNRLKESRLTTALFSFALV